jgi:NADH-quinone oxidoreductase subunit M
MSQLQLPWLLLSVAIPMLGSLAVLFVRNAETALRRSLIVAGLTLVCSLGAMIDFSSLNTVAARDPLAASFAFLGTEVLVIDTLSAPLLLLTCLIYFLTIMATLRTKFRRFSFSGTLFTQSILTALLSCREPWLLIALLICQAIVPYLEMRGRRRSARLFAWQMGLFGLLLVTGWWVVDSIGPDQPPPWLGITMVLVAVLIRCACVPFHFWLSQLFEKTTYSTALLFVTPLLGAYTAVRLLLPIAPEWALRTMVIFSLVTAAYSSGMALVQKNARRFVSYVFLSHSSLILIGLDGSTPIGLTGGLCMWLSLGLTITGFGLTLRALESRTGPLMLDRYHGFYRQTPLLAVFCLITGLAGIGFPGTVGFVASELLIEGAIQIHPIVGAVEVMVTALNGISILRAYFRLFAGAPHESTVCIKVRWPERLVFSAATIVILVGGLWPQPGVDSRFRAAKVLIDQRTLEFERYAAYRTHDNSPTAKSVERTNSTRTSALAKYQ